jgi:hypothetical protein
VWHVFGLDPNTAARSIAAISRNAADIPGKEND